MDTQYYKNKNIQCLNNLINKYNLGLHFDDFGMGVEVFYNSELVGYWFEWRGGIEFTFTRKFGGDSINYDNWDDVCVGIEDRIKELKS